MQRKQAILFLFLITFIVYFSAFWNQFVWDDEQFIYNNAYVKNFAVEKIFTTSTTEGAGIISNYYRPLATLSFAIDHAIWKLNPIGFHLTNLLLHISAGAVLFMILKRICLRTNVAFVIALLFLIHPLQTEAVTYINSRGDSLFVLFGLLSLYTFLLLLQLQRNTINIAGISFPISKWFLALLTAFWYACSVLSKEIGIVFGPLLFITWLLHASLSSMKLSKNWRWAMFTLAVCAFIAIGYLGLRASTLNFQNSFDFYQDQSDYSQSISVRLLTFTKVVFVYLRLLLVPFPLHMERSVDLVSSLSSFWPTLFLVANATVLIFAIKQFRGSKPLALYGFLWFYIALLPVSGIIPINGVLYEHWLYLPVIGFYLLVYAGIESLPVRSVTVINTYKLFVLIPLFTIFALLTIRQNYFWSTPVRLYSYLLQHTESGRIYNNLAMAFADENQLELALQNYDKALSYGDVYPQIHHNKGNVYRKLGNIEAAVEEFTVAISMDNNFSFSYQLLLATLIDAKRFEEAVALIKKAQGQFPNDPQWRDYEVQLQKLIEDESTGATTAATTSTSPAARGSTR